MTAPKPPLVSIVLPVYNVEDYLPQCLDSLCDQSFGDFEVLCVNDGSTDGCPQILADFAARDSRIKVINRKNGGLSVARDAALPYVQGKYIAFIDSDDYVTPDYLKKAVSAATSYDTDILLFSHKTYDHALEQEQQSFWALRIEQLPQQPVFNCHDIPDRIFQLAMPAVWNKLFKAEFILSNPMLRFGHFQKAEDYPFVYTAIALAKRIVAIDEYLYVYRANRPGSLLTERPNEPLSFFKPFRLLYSNLLSLGLYEELRDSYARRAAESTLWEILILTHPDDLASAVAFMESQGFSQLGIDCLWPVGQFSPQTVADSLDRHPGDVFNVVVPITDGFDWLEQFFAGLTKTRMSYRIIAIDDASEDKRVWPFLVARAAENEGFLALHNDTSKGFAACANQGFELAQGHVVLIDPRARCPQRWLERLSAPLLTKATVASATPYINAASPTSYPNWWTDNELPEGFDGALVDTVFAELSPMHPECLGGSAFCMALNRRVLLSIGGLDEGLDEQSGLTSAAIFDWCLRAEAIGYQNVMADDIYVYVELEKAEAGDATAEQQVKAESVVTGQTFKEQLVAALIIKHPRIKTRISIYEGSNPAHLRKDRVSLKLAYLNIELAYLSIQRESREQKDKIDELQNALKEKEGELQRVYESTSWRWTKPIRAIREHNREA